MAHVEIVDGLLDQERASAKVAAPEFGAVVTFCGNVRNNSRGERVRFLVYEAYRPLAEKELAVIAAEAESRWNIRCAIEHRLGRVEIGETSVIIAVASPHRGDAFDASRWLMDALKEKVPIWKKEYFESGARWVEGSDVVPSTD
jgi:molybdopterin synthase catalytic subunit